MRLAETEGLNPGSVFWFYFYAWCKMFDSLKLSIVEGFMSLKLVNTIYLCHSHQKLVNKH